MDHHQGRQARCNIPMAVTGTYRKSLFSSQGVSRLAFLYVVNFSGSQAEIGMRSTGKPGMTDEEVLHLILVIKSPLFRY